MLLYIQLILLSLQVSLRSTLCYCIYSLSSSRYRSASAVLCVTVHTAYPPLVTGQPPQYSVLLYIQLILLSFQVSLRSTLCYCTYSLSSSCYRSASTVLSVTVYTAYPPLVSGQPPQYSVLLYIQLILLSLQVSLRSTQCYCIYSLSSSHYRSASAVLSVTVYTAYPPLVSGQLPQYSVLLYIQLILLSLQVSLHSTQCYCIYSLSSSRFRSASAVLSVTVYTAYPPLVTGQPPQYSVLLYIQLILLLLQVSLHSTQCYCIYSLSSSRYRSASTVLSVTVYTAYPPLVTGQPPQYSVLLYIQLILLSLQVSLHSTQCYCINSLSSSRYRSASAVLSVTVYTAYPPLVTGQPPQYSVLLYIQLILLSLQVSLRSTQCYCIYSLSSSRYRSASAVLSDTVYTAYPPLVTGQPPQYSVILYIQLILLSLQVSLRSTQCYCIYSLSSSRYRSASAVLSVTVYTAYPPLISGQPPQYSVLLYIQLILLSVQVSLRSTQCYCIYSLSSSRYRLASAVLSVTVYTAYPPLVSGQPPQYSVLLYIQLILLSLQVSLRSTQCYCTYSLSSSRFRSASAVLSVTVHTAYPPLVTGQPPQYSVLLYIQLILLSLQVSLRSTQCYCIYSLSSSRYRSASAVLSVTVYTAYPPLVSGQLPQYSVLLYIQLILLSLQVSLRSTQCYCIYSLSSSRFRSASAVLSVTVYTAYPPLVSGQPPQYSVLLYIQLILLSFQVSLRSTQCYCIYSLSSSRFRSASAVLSVTVYTAYPPLVSGQPPQYSVLLYIQLILLSFQVSLHSTQRFNWVKKEVKLII